jgi:hypothetical protein
MRVRSMLWLLALVSAGMLPSDTSAATITYILDLTAPGTFTLKAAASTGDNAGIFLYGVPLLGNVLTLDNRAPLAINSANATPVGFSEVRSADITSATLNPEVTGSQSAFGPATNLVRGMGQEASSFAAKGFITFDSPSDATSGTAWLNPIVLATGTYSGTLSFNKNSVDLVGNVFPPIPTQAGYPQATIQTVVIPEPATVSLIFLAPVGCIGLVRRCR